MRQEWVRILDRPVPLHAQMLRKSRSTASRLGMLLDAGDQEQSPTSSKLALAKLKNVVQTPGNGRTRSDADQSASAQASTCHPKILWPNAGLRGSACADRAWMAGPQHHGLLWM